MGQILPNPHVPYLHRCKDMRFNYIEMSVS